MAKKIKRNVPSVASAAVNAPTTGNNGFQRPAAAPRASYTQEFNPDYSLVISDLKRIGAMSAFFIAVLVVASFFLR
jgi:hypothetical protein